MSYVSQSEPAFDFFLDPTTPADVKPIALFPWFRRVFGTADDLLRSPFDLDGEKPQCYTLHATTIEIESPPFSPEEVSKLVKEKSRPSDPDWLRVYKIAPDTIAKTYWSTDEAISEALNLSMITTMTTIPVPKVQEIAVNPKTAMTYLVMEYIDGQTLDSCWDRLTLLSKLRIAWTLRSYVAQLRRLQRTVPGTLNGSSCTGPLFTEYGAGPFASYDEMTAWFNHKLDVSQRMKQAPLNAPRFDNLWPLVFTHWDLCPRNVLLARDGKVYVLDWQRSGFYPAWFEYVGMLSDEHFKSRLWDFLIPWISHTVFPWTRKRILTYGRNIGWALHVGPLM
ncbi:kinase-like domain-containing protein [Phlebopus sp. FC_14]|nr:kinase-like domain-containing protein [Phlebopus sp. FC_14]